MKECWINVYAYGPKLQYQELGATSYSYFTSKAIYSPTSDRIGVYRLHVKLKDKPGLSREYGVWWF